MIVIIVVIVLVAQRAGQVGIAESVLVQVDGPERVTLGSDISYEVKIVNNSKNILNENRLVVIYPDGFSFTSADPLADNAPGTEYSFEPIAPGNEAVVRISGRLTGGVKTEQTIIARFQFTPVGSNEVLQVDGTFTTTIETAAFSFNADAPASVLPNNTVSLNLDLENNEERPLSKIRVRAVYPGGFTYNTADPEPGIDNDTWDVEELGIGEKLEFNIDGTLGVNVGEVKRFGFEAGSLDDYGAFLKQYETEPVIKLKQPVIQITQ